MEGKMALDRRNRRFPVMCKSEYTDKEFHVTDMSLEGMKIKTSFNFDKKLGLSFTLVLPTLDIIKINCDIVWEKRDDNNDYIYGVHLNYFNPNHKDLYVSYIHSLEDVQPQKTYQYS